MNKIGNKFVDGRMVNLDREPIENLEIIAKRLQENENIKRDQLDNALSKMINEE